MEIIRKTSFFTVNLCIIKINSFGDGEGDGFLVALGRGADRRAVDYRPAAVGRDLLRVEQSAARPDDARNGLGGTAVLPADGETAAHGAGDVRRGGVARGDRGETSANIPTRPRANCTSAS